MENDRGESQSLNSIEDAMAFLEEKSPVPDAQASAESPEADEEPTEVVSDEAESEESEDVATEEEQTVLTLDNKKLEIPKGTPPQVIEAVKAMESDLRADYTRKTQEIASERQTITAAKEQTMQGYQTLQTQAQALAQMAQALIGQPPSIELAQSDPQQYLVAKAMYEQRAGQFQALMGQAQEMSQQQRQHMEQQKSEFLREEATKLYSKMPELKSPEKFAEFRDLAVKVGQKYGLDPQEVTSTADHRVLLMLRDLARLDKSDGEVKKVTQKLNNAPPKVVKPSAVNPADKEKLRKDGMREFMKSGKSMRDVERLIRQGKL